MSSDQGLLGSFGAFNEHSFLQISQVEEQPHFIKKWQVKMIRF